MNKRHGFTIVELLIVIVVIAILAAITIVAFNGIQTRAENTKTIAGINQFGKAMALYKNDNGNYPLMPAGSGGVYVCVGNSSTQCGRVSGASGIECNYVGGPATGSSTFENALKTVGSSVPVFSDKTLNCEGKKVGGVYYYANASESIPKILYYLSGNQSCVTPGSSTVFYTYFFANGGTTACYLQFDI